jgi:hypothetical protein
MLVKYTVEFQQDAWDQMNELQRAEWLNEVKEAVNCIAYITDEEIVKEAQHG